MFIWASISDHETYRKCAKTTFNADFYLSRGVIDLNCGLSPLRFTCFVFARTEGSGETAYMRSLARAFAARICNKKWH